jgi:hypothetical protein
LLHTFKKGHAFVQVTKLLVFFGSPQSQQFIDIYHAKDADFQKATIKHLSIMHRTHRNDFAGGCRIAVRQ